MGVNMKYKKILIVTLILLAILSFGAVSASEDVDVIAQDSDGIVSQYNAIDGDVELNLTEEDAPTSDILSDAQNPHLEINAEEIQSGSDDATLISEHYEYESLPSLDNVESADILKIGNESFIDTALTAEDINTPYNSGDYFTVNLTDVNGYPIGDAAIIVAFEEYNETVYTGELGLAYVSVYGLKPGSYTPLIRFEGDEIYASSNTTANVVITRMDSVINAYNMITSYNSGEDLLVYLVDAYGYPIYDAAVIAVFGEFNETVYTDESGVANVSVQGLKPGAHTPLIKFEGDDGYNPSNTTANVVITKTNSDVVVEDITTEYNSGDDLMIYLEDSYGYPIYDAAVIAVFDEFMKTVYTDEYGFTNVSLKGLKPGSYAPSIMFVGNDCYNPSNTTANVVITKATTYLTTSYSGGILSALLRDNNGNPVVGAKVGFAVNGVTYIYTDENGEAKYFTDSLAEGTYTVRVKYYGDDSYRESNQIVTQIKVVKIPTNLKASDVSVLCHDENGYLVATLTDANGNAVNNAKVGFANNGVKYFYTDENGQAKYSTKDLAEGTYTVKIKFYGEGVYAASNQVTAKIVVGKIATSLRASDVSVLCHDENGYLVATLTDANGNAVNNAKVGFANNGVKYFYTDENGQAKYSTKDLAEGTYTVKIKYYGNDTYSASNQATAKIIVGKLATKLTSADVTVIHNKEGYLVATLKDANGKPISGAKVGFANNGVKYFYTDENGQARYPTKDLAIGTYTVLMKYYGDGTYRASNQISAKIYVASKMVSKLSSADVHVLPGEDGYLVATLKDANGKPISGAKVGFANNGVKYFYTDENGQAKYSTKDLVEGTYNVLMKFYGNDDYEASNQVSAKMYVGKYVTPSLTSNGVSTTYGANDYLVATLTGMNNKPIAGAKILFTVMGKKILDITDSSGHAKISTKGYAPAIYNVAFKYAGNSVYSAVTSSAKMIINKA